MFSLFRFPFNIIPSGKKFLQFSASPNMLPRSATGDPPPSSLCETNYSSISNFKGDQFLEYELFFRFLCQFVQVRNFEFLKMRSMYLIDERGRFALPYPRSLHFPLNFRVSRAWFCLSGRTSNYFCGDRVKSRARNNYREVKNSGLLICRFYRELFREWFFKVEINTGLLSFQTRWSFSSSVKIFESNEENTYKMWISRIGLAV